VSEFSSNNRSASAPTNPPAASSTVQSRQERWAPCAETAWLVWRGLSSAPPTDPYETRNPARTGGAPGRTDVSQRGCRSHPFDCVVTPGRCRRLALELPRSAPVWTAAARDFYTDVKAV
jgi:hypothetical protein